MDETLRPDEVEALLHPPPLELGEPQLRASATAARRVHQLYQSPSDVEREERGRGGLAGEEHGRAPAIVGGGAARGVHADLRAGEVDTKPTHVGVRSFTAGIPQPAFASAAAGVDWGRARGDRAGLIAGSGGPGGGEGRRSSWSWNYLVGRWWRRGGVVWIRIERGAYRLDLGIFGRVGARRAGLLLDS